MSESRTEARRLSVLLVSDDASGAGSLCAALRRRSHSVRIATAAEDALAEERCDALVLDLDLELSGIDALALYDQLRARQPQAHVVLLAAVPSLELCRAAMQRGAADLLSKPWPLDEVLAAVERAPEPSEGERKRLRLTQPSTESGLDHCLRRLSAFALEQGLGPGARVRLVSACAEVLENVARHAYGEGLGPIELCAEREQDGMRVRVRDHGAGLDPVHALLEGTPAALPGGERESREAPPQPEPELGRGLGRVRSLVEDVRFLELAEGSAVELWAVDAPLGFAEEGPLDLSDAEWLTPEQARALAAREGEGARGLSPALRAALGRLMAAPDPRETARAVLWS